MASNLLYSLVVVSCFLIFETSAQYVIDSTTLGRRFDGIGGISGGGATSKLLVGYPENIRKEILDYLFVPNFAASLQICKVEIGGDAQSTDGTESSHMHEPWDENYKRGYEWWLMLEAKKRNPNIKLYGLPWAFPGWVGRGTGNPYKFPNDTAMYVVKWVLAAKKLYNLDIDYIGIWNEREYDKTYVKTLRSMLNDNGFSKVELVVGDGGWEPAPDVLNDPSFASAVSYLGCHYPGTNTTMDAIKTGKPLWASEDYSTFNDNVGAGCWARILNQNYVNGFMTSTISWNLIASYYSGLPYDRDGLMTAKEPWSGHYVVETPIWITAHTTQFTDIGWSYLNHGKGVGLLAGGGSYVSLTSPDKSQLTIIIETMSHDHSVCIRPGLPAYNVTAQQAEFVLTGVYSNIEELHVWKTQLNFDGKPSNNVFIKQQSVKPYLGMFTLTLEVDQVVTLTTVERGMKGEYGTPPESKPFPFPYSDDFESYAEYSEAYNFAPQSGVWEVMDSGDTSHKKINRQVLLNDPVYWCETKPATINVGGDDNWSDVFVKTDIYVPSVNGSNGAFVAARVDRGGCDASAAQGVFFYVFTSNNSYMVTSDMGFKNVLSSGPSPIALKNNTWYTLSLIVKASTAMGLINETGPVFHVNIPANIKLNGFVGYGTPRLGLADFDNLVVQPAGSYLNFPQLGAEDKNIDQSEVEAKNNDEWENRNDIHYYPSEVEAKNSEKSQNDIHFYPLVDKSQKATSKSDLHFYPGKTQKGNSKEVIYGGRIPAVKLPRKL